MKWYIEKDGKAEEIPEEVLVYKIKHGELAPGTLVVNHIIKSWTPIHSTSIWTDNYKENANNGVMIKPQTQTTVSPVGEKAVSKSNTHPALIIFVVAFLLILLVAFVVSKSSSSKTGGIDHSNCMFIGYADPNRPLTGSSHVSSQPQYGYRAVYVRRDNIYNSYHFH